MNLAAAVSFMQQHPAAHASSYDITSEGDTPLHLALAEGNEEVRIDCMFRHPP